jgi:hypothetical protein
MTIFNLNSIESKIFLNSFHIFSFTNLLFFSNSVSIFFVFYQIHMTLHDINRCFLYFLDDTSGQLNRMDKSNGNVTSIGNSAPGGFGNLALSASDNAIQLFGSNGFILVRIDVVDGNAIPIVPIPNLEVLID